MKHQERKKKRGIETRAADTHTTTPPKMEIKVEVSPEPMAISVVCLCFCGRHHFGTHTQQYQRGYDPAEPKYEEVGEEPHVPLPPLPVCTLAHNTQHHQPTPHTRRGSRAPRLPNVNSVESDFLRWVINTGNRAKIHAQDRAVVCSNSTMSVPALALESTSS